MERQLHGSWGRLSVSSTSRLSLIDPGNPDAFAATLNALLSDPVLARRMGEAGRLRVRHRYLGPRHLVQYLQLFRRLILSEQQVEVALDPRRPALDAQRLWVGADDEHRAVRGVHEAFADAPQRLDARHPSAAQDQ